MRGFVFSSDQKRHKLFLQKQPCKHAQYDHELRVEL